MVFFPQILHFNRGCSIIFTLHFGGYPPFLGNPLHYRDFPYLNSPTHGPFWRQTANFTPRGENLQPSLRPRPWGKGIHPSIHPDLTPTNPVQEVLRGSSYENSQVFFGVRNVPWVRTLEISWNPVILGKQND